MNRAPELATTTSAAIASSVPGRVPVPARNAVEYEAMGAMLTDLYPDVPLPKRL